MTSRSSWGWSWTALALAIASPFQPADARAAAPGREETRQLDIPAEPLAAAIADLSRQAGISIGTTGALPRATTRPVRGRMTPEAALAHMLAGTGLAAQRVGPSAWRIVAAAKAAPPVQRSPASPARRPDTRSMEPIIVRAVKQAVPLLDLPRAVSVVSLQPAEQGDCARNTQSIADATEGVTLTGLGPGRNQIFVRGVADSPFSGRAQSTVAVVLDDSRLTYSAPDPDLRLVDVKQVEVLKGPQGSLYGTGALGGIYRIVTNRADPTRNSLHLETGGEVVQSGGAGWSASGIGNLVLVRDVAALRVVGYTVNEPGWIDTGNRHDANSTHVLGGRAEFGLVPAAGWRIDVTGQIQRIETRDSQYTYAPDALSRPAQLPEPHDNDLDFVSARITGRIGQVEALAVSSITRHEVLDTLDATVGAQGFGLANPALFTDDRHYRVWDSELRFTGNFGQAHWLVGVAHLEANRDAVRALASAGGASTLQIDDSQDTAADTGLFGDVTVPLGAGFSAEAGARLFRGVIETRRTSIAGSDTEDLRRTGVTPSASLSWSLPGKRLIYLRYGTAFRQGGLDYTETGATEAFAGDKLATLEAGWREELGGGGLLDLGAYYTWWNDVQSDMLLANGLIETRNAGNARILGGEATLTRPFARGWTLELGAAVQDARLVRDALGYPLDDRRLPVVPAYTLRGSLAKGFALGRLEGSVKLALRYVGPARLSFDPAIDRKMGNYLDAALEARARVGGVDLGLTVANLLDGREDIFSLGNPLRLRTMRQYTPQRPRTVSLTVSRSF